MKFCIAIFIAVVLYIGGLDAESRITLYEDSDYRGVSAVVTIHGCKDVPGPLRNRVSSVHTHGGCALLCDRPRCHGRCEIVDYPIRPNAAITDHFDLSKSNFNDVVASIRQC